VDGSISDPKGIYILDKDHQQSRSSHVRMLNRYYSLHAKCDLYNFFFNFSLKVIFIYVYSSACD